MIKYLILLVAFTSCAVMPPIHVIPELQPYLEAFIEEAEMRSVPGDRRYLKAYETSIHFEEMYNPAYDIFTVGKCARIIVRGLFNSKVIRIVTVDPVEWKHYSELMREQLIFHELGHCALSRPHLDEWDDDKPLSIMNSWMISESTVNLHWEYYLNELFN